MKCPFCGEEISDKAKFCTKCGGKIDHKRICQQCGAELKESTKFCPQCGTKIDRKRICQQCGAELKENTKFCPQCGTPYQNTAAVAQEEEKAPLKQEPKNECSNCNADKADMSDNEKFCPEQETPCSKEEVLTKNTEEKTEIDKVKENKPSTSKIDDEEKDITKTEPKNECSNCNAEISDNEKFCPEQETLRSKEEVLTKNTEEKTEIDEVKESKPSTSKRKFPILALIFPICVVVIAAIVLAVTLAFQKTEHRSTYSKGHNQENSGKSLNRSAKSAYYECYRCGLVVKSKDKPEGNCTKTGASHDWRKLTEVGTKYISSCSWCGLTLHSDEKIEGSHNGHCSKSNNGEHNFRPAKSAYYECYGCGLVVKSKGKPSGHCPRTKTFHDWRKLIDVGTKHKFYCSWCGLTLQTDENRPHNGHCRKSNNGKHNFKRNY